jgi:hypothetical protein
MPYSAIPTFVDGDILTASDLNTLSANQEFLFSLGNAANAPFNSVRVNTGSLDESVAFWRIRHRLDYLHFKITTVDSSNDEWVRVYYNGVKVYGDEAPSGGEYADVYDLSSWASLPNLVGAWLTATAYEDDVNGDGDDGSVVTNGGEYYRCLLSHTSGADDEEPGVGANWETYWDLLVLPGVGTMCQVWVRLSKSIAEEVTVEYIFETDSASL